MERYSAILILGNFAAAPLLVARALGIEVAPGAEPMVINSPDEAYARGDEDTGRPNTRHIIFYQVGDWTVLADWNFDFPDDHYPIAGSGVLGTDVVSVQGIEDQGFGFTYAKGGNLVRSILIASGQSQQSGIVLPEELDGAPESWHFDAPNQIAQALGAPDIYEDVTVPCFSLELELYPS